MSAAKGVPASASERVRNAFRFRTLDRPTISRPLRERVAGAYAHLEALYSFLTPDIHLGQVIFQSPALNRTGYKEYERTFNSVLLATLLNALLNGSIIFFGPPGSGKTTTPEVVGQVLFGLTLKQIEEATIYGHPNLTEEKMTASFDIPKLMAGVREVNWSRWVLEFYRMLDEANRVAPEITSILLQAIDRRRVSYAGVTQEMPFGPVSATANYFDTGNFEMTRPFLDRFGISVHTEGLSPQHLDRIFEPGYAPEESLDRESYKLGSEAREQVFAEIHSIAISPSTLALLVHLASGLSSCHLAGNQWYEKHKGRFGEQRVECSAEGCGFDAARVACSQINEQGLTSRALFALRDYSRALAWFLGREIVDEEVMEIAFMFTQFHRLSPSRKALNGGEAAEGVEVARNLFVRRTHDFTRHLWGMGVSGFAAQKPIYDELDRFYESVAIGSKTPEALRIESEGLLVKVDAMEDPAKWEMLKALHQIRLILRARRG